MLPLVLLFIVPLWVDIMLSGHLCCLCRYMSGWKRGFSAIASMSSTDSLLELTILRLRAVRFAILRLHKTLLNSERVVYEQFYGRVSSKGEFFRLVIEHEWFSWLRPISQFIIQIDDVLNAKEPLTLEQVNALLDQARVLLNPAKEGNTIEKRYYQAIQRDPDIALMHAEVAKLLN
jgi:hypothetical protein